MTLNTTNINSLDGNGASNMNADIKHPDVMNGRIVWVR